MGKEQRSGVRYVNSQNRILVDANGLVPYILGRAKLNKHRRFNIELYEYLVQDLQKFRKFATTAPCFWEVAHLVQGETRNQREHLYRDVTIAELSQLASKWEIVHIPPKKIVENRHFTAIGGADVSLLLAAHRQDTVWTADAHLYQLLSAKAGVSVINPWHQLNL